MTIYKFATGQTVFIRNKDGVPIPCEVVKQDNSKVTFRDKATDEEFTIPQDMLNFDGGQETT